jgi:hypothetical protein
MRERMPGPPLGGGMWGRGVGPGNSAYSRESMMIVFTATESGLAVTAVTIPCDLMATATCDEGHRFQVRRSLKWGTEFT